MPSFTQALKRCIELLAPQYPSQFRKLEHVISSLVYVINIIGSFTQSSSLYFLLDEGYATLLSKMKRNNWILQYQARKLTDIAHHSMLLSGGIYVASMLLSFFILVPLNSSVMTSRLISLLASFAEIIFIAPHIDCAITALFMDSVLDSFRRQTKLILYEGPAWAIAEVQWQSSEELHSFARSLKLTHSNRP